MPFAEQHESRIIASFAGIECCRLTDLPRKPLTPERFAAYKLDPAIRSVVMGLDDSFDYESLCIGSAYIREGGCHFVATNMDAGDRVGALEYARRCTLDVGTHARC